MLIAWRVSMYAFEGRNSNIYTIHIFIEVPYLGKHKSCEGRGAGGCRVSRGNNKK